MKGDDRVVDSRGGDVDNNDASFEQVIRVFNDKDFSLVVLYYG